MNQYLEIAQPQEDSAVASWSHPLKPQAFVDMVWKTEGLLWGAEARKGLPPTAPCPAPRSILGMTQKLLLTRAKPCPWAPIHSQLPRAANRTSAPELCNCWEELPRPWEPGCLYLEVPHGCLHPGTGARPLLAEAQLPLIPCPRNCRALGLGPKDKSMPLHSS